MGEIQNPEIQNLTIKREKENWENQKEGYERLLQAIGVQSSEVKSNE